eukprot:TRINITY_DN442_c0_g1_i1.p1 TRINITY_DN442_c0_g1~~TRINITY_DN442_c0_g1_i1.p1  ORF type:complete len:166 (-),score=14.79 TRINITY_DN442_c0_g1_i1:286-783(-)
MVEAFDEHFLRGSVCYIMFGALGSNLEPSAPGPDDVSDDSYHSDLHSDDAAELDRIEDAISRAHRKVLGWMSISNARPDETGLCWEGVCKPEWVKRRHLMFTGSHPHGACCAPGGAAGDAVLLQRLQIELGESNSDAAVGRRRCQMCGTDDAMIVAHSQLLRCLP